MNIIIDDQLYGNIEMSERKGLGHPDTICDMISDNISLALSDYYYQNFGTIMHHNVDKALLIGGQSQPAYGGGKTTQPMELIIAGRATDQVNGRKIPVPDIALETARNWLTNNIRHIDIDRDVEITVRIRPGSNDLVELFNRFGQGEIPLANDTSLGVGYYPNTSLETAIIRIEELLNHRDTKSLYPFIGEDIKVMGVKNHAKRTFTISIAVVDRYIQELRDYISKIDELKKFVQKNLLPEDASIAINTADDYTQESLFLTVTGTSAESGDDGQVGRGNRINGLISPYFPMVMEAWAGKNPVNHVGKIYNQFAMDLSRSIVENHYATLAQVFIVSQIGKPIDQPQLLHLKLRDIQIEESIIRNHAAEKLSELPLFWKQVIGLA